MRTRKTDWLERLAMGCGLDTGAAADARQDVMLDLWQRGFPLPPDEVGADKIVRTMLARRVIDESRQTLGRSRQLKRKSLPPEPAVLWGTAVQATSSQGPEELGRQITWLVRENKITCANAITILNFLDGKEVDRRRLHDVHKRLRRNVYSTVCCALATILES